MASRRVVSVQAIVQV